MSSTVVEASPSQNPGSLGELVDRYGAEANLPQVDWLTQLQLERPRRNMQCLGWGMRTLKRTTDLVLAVSMLILLAPVMLLVAALVKLTSPGPAIFKQTRVGVNLRRSRRDRRRNMHLRDLPIEVSQDRRGFDRDRRVQFAHGKPFIIYKFRTMRTDAEKNGAQLAVRNDPRITPIGRFLRKTRLDELPQLWNVIRGDMSMVGPRPERPEFIEELSEEVPDYLQRLGLKPGLTGVAQIVNGYDVDLNTVRRKVALDLLYLQNCCLRNDLKILFKTIRVVLTGSGAL